MEITVKELYEGFPCLIKNKEFSSAKQYAEPFLERMSKYTNDFRIQIKEADTLSVLNDNANKIYSRVLIQAVMPKEASILSHDEVVGFLYGIDVKKPVAKIYRGYLNQACTNLTVFNPQWINIQELIPGEPLNYNPIKSLLEQTNNFENQIKSLKETFIDRNKRKEYLGEWVDYSLRNFQDYGFGKVKISSSTPIDAYKQLFIDQESEYYIPEGFDPSMFDIYNSFTQIITSDKRDLLNKPEKTILIGELLNVLNLN